MKAREVEQIFKTHGAERGALVVCTALVEQVNQIEKNLKETAMLTHQLVDTVSNVVEGTHAMRGQMIGSLKKAGISVDSEEVESDGLGPATNLIGENKQ